MKKKAIILLLFMHLGVLQIFSKSTEKLLGISLNYETKEVTISVVSTGCTQKNDFTFNMVKEVLTVNRIKEDYCKAMEEIVTFTYSFEAAKIDSNKPFVIGNKFVANPFTAKIKD